MSWRSDGTGIQPGGDVGGDYQATDAHGIRYHHSTRPGAVVTVYTYAEHSGARYVVTTQTEMVVCGDRRDPGGTEQWAMQTYQTGRTVYATVAEADRKAREILKRHDARDIRWDGRAFGEVTR